MSILIKNQLTYKMKYNIDIFCYDINKIQVNWLIIKKF